MAKKAAKKKEMREFPVRSWEEFLSWSSGLVLMHLVDEGGPGIKNALIKILSMHDRYFSRAESK